MLGPVSVLVVAGLFLGNPFGIRDVVVDTYMGLAARIAQDQADKFKERTDRQLEELRSPTPSAPATP
ncbi:MAG: hypothetical protein LH477_17060 [Nocardioides sp.]|nr:hypothetical protein [Nocardioides sp.]